MRFRLSAMFSSRERSWAEFRGQRDLAALLLGSKAEVNAKDNNDETPLLHSTVRFLAIPAGRKGPLEDSDGRSSFKS
jgi:hypothetical protein